MIYIRECPLESHITQLLFLNLVLAIQGPHMIVVVMVSSVKKLEIKMANFLMVLGE